MNNKQTFRVNMVIEQICHIRYLTHVMETTKLQTYYYIGLFTSSKSFAQCWSMENARKIRSKCDVEIMCLGNYTNKANKVFERFKGIGKCGSRTREWGKKLFRVTVIFA